MNLRREIRRAIALDFVIMSSLGGRTSWRGSIVCAAQSRPGRGLAQSRSPRTMSRPRRLRARAAPPRRRLLPIRNVGSFGQDAHRGRLRPAGTSPPLSPRRRRNRRWPTGAATARGVRSGRLPRAPWPHPHRRRRPRAGPGATGPGAAGRARAPHAHEIDLRRGDAAGELEAARARARSVYVDSIVC